MEELAALLFWAFGLSSYPLVFFLSLKKSVSLASKGNVANSRTFASLIAIYLESVLLSSMIAYFCPIDWPPYSVSSHRICGRGILSAGQQWSSWQFLICRYA